MHTRCTVQHRAAPGEFGVALCFGLHCGKGRDEGQSENRWERGHTLFFSLA